MSANSSIVYSHNHNNKKVLDNFSENSDGALLYKGNIVDEDTNHKNLSVYSNNGAHGLRFYNNKLWYQYAGSWREIVTAGSGGSVGSNEIQISTTANNALKKYSNGYYVPALPINNATMEDVTDTVNNAVDELNNTITEKETNIQNQYNNLVTKVNTIASSITKQNTHNYSGIYTALYEICDVSTLYTSEVILNMELLIQNASTSDELTVQVKEYDIVTLNEILKKEEVQKYKLSNNINTKILIKGKCNIYLYVSYI